MVDTQRYVELAGAHHEWKGGSRRTSMLTMSRLCPRVSCFLAVPMKPSQRLTLYWRNESANRA